MEEGKEHERPSVGVIGYGSLLSLDELVPFLETDASRVVPVRVEGFRRLFNEESVWRVRASEGDDEERAVLNAVRDEGCSMNAVLVPDVSAEEYEALRVRESGYRMVEVEDDEIEPYADEEDEFPEGVEDDIVLVPTGREERVDDDLLPIPEYVEICLEGARHWGDGFHEEFVRTTYVRGGAGGTLRDYLDDEGG